MAGSWSIQQLELKTAAKKQLIEIVTQCVKNNDHFKND